MARNARIQDVNAIHSRLAETREARAATRQLIAKGQWTRADPDPDRMRSYLMRIGGRRGAEALRGVANELQGVAFLEEGADVARAVGKVQVSTGSGLGEGTGFLVHPGVMLTNQHVIRDVVEASRATISFSYEFDRDFRPRASTTFALAPERLAIFSPEGGGLDYALIALGGRIEGAADISAFGYCPLLASSDRHLVGMPVNIVQHPQGRRKEIAVRANRLTHRTDRCLLYETDTEVGSSGAPVFNDDWDVVALHHYGEPFTALGESGAPSPDAAVNEGIRISAIVDDLRRRLPGLDAVGAALLAEVLSLGEEVPVRGGLRLRPPRAGETHRVVHTPARGAAGEVRVTVAPSAHPVTITLALGGPTQTAPQPTAEEPSRAPAVLTRLAEAKRLDKDYSNRDGFDEKFIPRFPVDLATIVAPKLAQCAKLLDGTRDALSYQHFSVFMHATRRLAMLAATNIDAASYLEIDRKTGQVGGASEGETWYKDPRIDVARTITQDFYSAWSHYFDRGHLVRRTDPIYGTEATALRAHADTFHFTNCTPQHFRFNQSTEYWQGMERYVLEKGVLDEDANAQRISVLQGPIFRSDDWIAEYDDEDGMQKIKVPGAFWKLALWRGAKGKQAFAMIASQVPLWNEERRNVSRPSDTTPIEVDQFRVSVQELSLATGLDFGAFVSADTFGTSGVRVAEGRRLISSWEHMGL